MSRVSLAARPSHSGHVGGQVTCGTTAFRSPDVRPSRDSPPFGMSEREKIFVFGAGGHAKVVIDAIEREGRHVIACVCDDAVEKHGTQVMRYEIVRGRDDLLARKAESR